MNPTLELKEAIVQPLQQLEALRPQLPAPRAVANGLRLIGVLLRELERAALLPGDAPRAAALAVARRVAQAMLAVLEAARPAVSAAAWRDVVLYRRVLGDLFGAAGDAVVAGEPGAQADTPPGTLPLPLAIAPLECVPQLGAELQALPAEERMLAAISWLADPVVISSAQAAGRDWLITHTELLQTDRINVRFAVRLASAWMFCSYADHPDRHAVKRALNSSIALGLQKAGIRPPAPVQRPRSGSGGERPLLLVVAERFRRIHAMFRCYAPSIAQLRGRYRVVILGQPAQLDDGADALADEVWHVPTEVRGLAPFVDRIVQARPDAIFFPSVGMSFWSIALANLRLAPLQFMSIGHPASSFSPHMDCMVLGGDVLGDPACFSETLVVRDAPGNPIHPPRDPWGPAPQPRDRPEQLEIAVPAMAAKISPAFVTLCRRLAREAGRPLRFHFFPNRGGMGTRHVETALNLAFAPEVDAGVPVAVVVHPSVQYTRYMERLAGCDLALATFPFGNANSTVDCLLLGKPVIALEGDEPAARTDRRMLRLVGAPDWLLCDTRDRYFDAALRLVRDDALRVATARAILDSDPAQALFERERARHPDDFADVVDWMLDNVTLIRRDPREGGRKVWWPADRRAATPPVE